MSMNSSFVNIAWMTSNNLMQPSSATATTWRHGSDHGSRRSPSGWTHVGRCSRSWVDSYEGGADNPLGIFIGSELVGSTGLHDRNEPDDIEIGYWVDQAHQGVGIARRVTAALMVAAFAEPTVQRFLLVHNLDNQKSRRVPEQLGFRIVPGEHTCSDAEATMWEFTRDVWEARR